MAYFHISLKERAFLPPLKPIRLLVALLLLLTGHSRLWAAYDFTAENEDGVMLYYRVLSEDDKTVAIVNEKDGSTKNSDYQNTYTAESINIPSHVSRTIEGEETATIYTVTAIGTRAFMYGQMETITIPETVTSLGTYSFSFASKLTSVHLPSGITILPTYCFAGCSSLKEINLENIETIGDRSLGLCGFTELTIPSNVTTMDYACLANCSQLEKLVIKANISSFGNSLCFQCTKLNEVTFPSTLEEVSNLAFYQCGELSSIALPSSVTTINTSAFRECTSLKDIILPSDLTTIGTYAFRGCNALEKIVIPSKTETIGAYAFAFCEKLSEVDLSSATALQEIGDYAFYYSQTLSKVDFLSATSLSVIRSSAFASCALSELKFPPSLRTIEQTAFSWGNKGVTSISLNEGLESLYDCFIHYNTEDGHYIQKNNVTSLHLPSTLREVGVGAFFSNTDITVAEGNGYFKVEDGVLFSMDGKNLLSYPQSKTDETYTIPEGVENIYPLAFYHAKIKNLTLPSTLRKIGYGAFDDIPLLRQINYPAGTTDLSVMKDLSLHDESRTTSAHILYTLHPSTTFCPALAYMDLSSIDNANIAYHLFYNGSDAEYTDLHIEKELTSPIDELSRDYTGVNPVDVSVGGPFCNVFEPTLIYLPKGNALTGKNYINTDDGTTFTCEEYEAYDYTTQGAYNAANRYKGMRPYYAIPHAFTAGKATLKRTFNNAGGGKKFTVCLPFAVSATDFGTFYKFTSFDNETNTITFDEVADAQTEPNVPYLFMPKDGETIESLTADNAEVAQVSEGIVENGTYAQYATTDAAGNQFIGVYEYQALPDGMFTYKDDHFGWTRNAQTVPFRCYLKPVTPYAEGKQAAVVFRSREATGIDRIEQADGKPVTGCTAGDIYTLSGQRVTTTGKGIYILNGKKIVIQ